MRAAAKAVVVVVGVAVAARLVHGPGLLGYDALWALRWGQELLALELPDYEAALAPTPHPLLNLVMAGLSLGGPDTATTMLLGLSWLSLGVLALGIVDLGRTLFSLPVGVIAAAVIVTRPPLVAETGQALIDLPFLALAVLAIARAARDPDDRAIPWLLLAAGLLRPEGWALAVAYLVWRRPGVRRAAVLVAAPVLWAVGDWVVTGDPLYSLQGTRELAEALGRPRGAGSALTEAPAALRDILGWPVLAVGLAGGTVAILREDRRALLPGAIAVLGVLGFIVLGLGGLPVLARYLLLPALMLVLLGGAVHRGPRSVPLAVAALVVVAIGVPATVGDLDETRGYAERRRDTQELLREAARAVEGRRDSCLRILAPDSRSRAVVRAQIGEPASSSDSRGALVFSYARPAAAVDYALGLRPRDPIRGRQVFRNRDWVVSAARGC